MADPYYVNDLKSGEVWANDKTGVALTYTFWQSVPSYYAGETESHNFQPFTGAMEDAVRDIFAQISSFCNITFNEIAPTNAAQLAFGQARLDTGVAAWAYYPDTTYGGDVWTNNLYADSRDVAHGDFGFATLVHEIGHALGLKHSFEGPNALPDAEDNSRYTVMSYTDIYQDESYMIYDIAALQSMYGANYNYNSGNDSYTLLSGHAYTIWDGGGTDTLDGSAQTAAMKINLNAGKFSSVGLTDNIAIAYNVVIENANGGSGGDTIYDNGAGNIIHGNGGNDIIYGGAGNDMFDGDAGTDKVIYAALHTLFSFSILDDFSITATAGAFGTDTLTDIESVQFSDGTYSFAQLVALAGGGSGGTGGEEDPPPSGSTDQILTGTSIGDRLTGAEGNDTLTGLGGTDVLTGNAGDDFLDGGFGGDKMFGGTGDDVFYVDATGDRVTELLGGGTDTVHATVSHTLAANVDHLVLEGIANLNGNGNGLANELTGNAGNNNLRGMTGNDTLDGGAGRDVLTGGAGADVFKFSAATAYTGAPDVVADFYATQGDSLDISDLLTGYDPLSATLGEFADFRTIGRTTQLWVDADGSGTGADFVHIATLNKVTTLADEDAAVASHLLIVA